MDVTHDMRASTTVADAPITGSPRATNTWRRLRTSFVDRVAAGTAPAAVQQLQFTSMVKQLEALQSESCFVASNVFFEILFARAVAVHDMTTAVYLGGTTTTFCLAACVHTVASATLAYATSHSALDSSASAVEAIGNVVVRAHLFPEM